MKFKSRLEIAAHPDLVFRTRADPLGLDLQGEGALEVAVGEIAAQIAEIPVSFTIPFMPSRRQQIVAGTIGPFFGRILPTRAEIRGFGLRLAGTVGTNGIEGDLRVKGECRAEIDLSGDLPARILKAAVEGAFEE
jgi:hypothetical protein